MTKPKDGEYWIGNFIWAKNVRQVCLRRDHPGVSGRPGWYCCGDETLHEDANFIPVKQVKW